MPYSPESYDPRYYDTGGIAGGSLLHDRASTVWALALELDSGYPVTYPRTFDAPPFRVSSLDLTTDGTSLGAVFHEGRLLDAPVVVAQALDEFAAVRTGEALRFRCVAAPTWSAVNLHTWVAAEHRGKPVTGWLVDLDPMTLAPLAATQAFRGEVLAMSDDPGTADILVRVFDVLALTQPVPVSRVAVGWAPYAPPAGLGQIVPHGIGIGRRIRCHPIKARSLDDTLLEYTVTASAGSDTLTIGSGYDWETGDGPVRVSTTGALPGGLGAGVDYFVIVVDETTLRLATTRGNALAGTFLDITSTGSGTHTIRSGVAPNLDEHTDFVVGVGNVTVNQVWLNGETETPEWPLDYQVLTQAYRADGRYLTVLRFPGDVADMTVEADVLRVDPDVDGSCVLDCKFARGFIDDARQATLGVTGATTAALVRGVHRFGLGAVRCDPGAGVTLTLPLVVRAPTRSIHLIWTAPRTTDDCILYADGSVSLSYNGTQQLLVLIAQWPFAAGDPGSGETTLISGGEMVTVWFGITSSGSVPRGVEHDLLIRINASTGLIELLLGGLVLLSHTKVRPLYYATAQAVAGPLTGTLHRLRVWARAISDAEYQVGWWRWRRNGIAWIEELCGLGGLRMEPTATALAQAAWQLVESGSLVVDGWMTQETELRAALLAVMQLRSVRLTMDGGLVAPSVPTSAPPVTAALGHGDAQGNLVELPSRVRASKTEAPSKVVVRYRRERTGEVSDYSRTAERPAFAADGQALTIDAPFVDDPTAADIVADWVTKRLLARDQVIQASCGHEARDLAVGDRVTLDIPAMGIAWDAEVIGRERAVQRQGVTVVPWATSAFTYTPAPLAPDPVSPLFEPLDLGTAPFLTAAGTSGVVRLETIPANKETLRPIETIQLASPRTQYPDGDVAIVSVVGGSAHAALDETAIAGDTSYVYIDDVYPPDLSTYNYAFFGLSAPAGAGVPVKYVQRIRAARGAADHEEQIHPAAWSGTPSVPSPVTLSITPTTYTWTFLLAGLPTWTRDAVNRLKLGWATLSAAPLEKNLKIVVTAMGVDIYLRPPVRDPGAVRYYVVGPSATQPATPAEDAPIAVEARDFGPQTHAPGGSPGQTFWYWSRVYDAVGRLVATLGPVAVVI